MFKEISYRLRNRLDSRINQRRTRASRSGRSACFRLRPAGPSPQRSSAAAASGTRSRTGCTRSRLPVVAASAAALLLLLAEFGYIQMIR